MSEMHCQHSERCAAKNLFLQCLQRRPNFGGSRVFAKIMQQSQCVHFCAPWSVAFY